MWLILLAGYLVAAVSSQSALDLFIILMFLGWMGVVVRERSFAKSARPGLAGIEMGFAAYFAVACLGFIFNAAPGAPWAHALGKFVWILHFYLLLFVLQQVRINAKLLIQFFFVGYLLPTLYALAAFVHGTDFITGRETSRLLGLVSSWTYHAHANAQVFVFFAAILILQWMTIPKLWRALGTLGLVLLGLSIFLTFTRGIWISISLSTVVMFFIWNKRKGMILTAAMACIIGLAYVGWPTFHNRVNDTFVTGGDLDRVTLLKANVQMFKEYPILGIGYGENMRRVREYWDRWGLPKGFIESHAHNQWLNVLSCTGILGLIAFLSIWIFFLSKNWKMLKATDQVQRPLRYTILFACLWVQVEFIFGTMTDVSFEYAKIRALLLCVWALVICLQRKPQILESP